jgi:hypothetical protein
MVIWEPWRPQFEAAAALASRKVNRSVKVPCKGTNELGSMGVFLATLREPHGLEHAVQQDGREHAVVVFGGEAADRHGSG